MSILAWIIIAVILAVLEIVTVGFFLFFFALGALVTGVVSLFTNDLMVQCGVFLVSSIGFTLIGRPVIKKYFNVGDKPPASNVAKLHGEPVVVLEPVSRYGGKVKIIHTGEVWGAYLLCDEEGVSEIAPGEEGLIERVDGAKLAVKPVKK